MKAEKQHKSRYQREHADEPKRKSKPPVRRLVDVPPLRTSSGVRFGYKEWRWFDD